MHTILGSMHLNPKPKKSLKIPFQTMLNNTGNAPNVIMLTEKWARQNCKYSIPVMRGSSFCMTWRHLQSTQS